jgi:hypothetical protein
VAFAVYRAALSIFDSFPDFANRNLVIYLLESLPDFTLSPGKTTC